MRSFTAHTILGKLMQVDLSSLLVVACVSALGLACSSPDEQAAPLDGAPSSVGGAGGAKAEGGLTNVTCSTEVRPDVERWESAINEFQSRDNELPPPEQPIVFTGSSSIRLWSTLAEDMAPHGVINNGFGGSHLNDTLFYLESTIVPYDPRAVVVYAGENDLNASVPVGCVFRDWEAIVLALRRAGIDAPLFFVSMKPSPKRADLLEEMKRTNGYMEAYASITEGVTYIDVMSPMLTESGEPRTELFSDDELHMNEVGYSIWTKRIKPHLDALK